MRILIYSLILLGGLNLVLAGSIYWNAHDSMANNWFNNYNYDDELFEYPSNRPTDDIVKFILNENSEEALLHTATEGHNVVTRNEESEVSRFASFFSDSFQDIDSTIREKSEEDIEKEMSNTEDDNEDDKNDDEVNNQFEIFLHVPSDNMETDLVVSKSSEEKKDDDEGNSDEATPAPNMLVELIDLTKSSEEKKQVDEEVDLSKKEIDELAALILTLTAIDDLMKIAQENPDYADNEQDDELKSHEVDEYLHLFTSILDKMLEDEQTAKENEENNDDVTTPQNDSDEEDNDYTTPKNDSNEDDDTDDTDDDYTTPKNDSNEDDDTKTSNSNENGTEDFSIVFHIIDDDHHESNLNDHKYEIVKTSPYMNKIIASSSSRLDNQNVIQEYVGIRQDLDSEQVALQTNKLNLDKDFYTIISDDFNEDSINKFEKDFFVVHENVDRIKRNVNAMQNLNSKLYIHKLIKDALTDVQHK